jgi:hypothetical protein
MKSLGDKFANEELNGSSKRASIPKEFKNLWRVFDFINLNIG